MDNNKNKIKKQKAVAIKYNPMESAPKVVAKGQGLVAEKIIESAITGDVPVHQDKELVEELSKVDLGSQIPPELYEVVAQVLVFISDLDKMESYKKHVKPQ